MVDKYNVVVSDKDTLKNILIIAGIHGNEIGTISLAYDLIHTISHTKKEELQTLFPDIREITILPVANYEAMRSCKRDIVHTTNDLNRGWFTDRYSTIRTDILDEIEKADVVIDMNSLYGKDTFDKLKFLIENVFIKAIYDNNVKVKKYMEQVEEFNTFIHTVLNEGYKEKEDSISVDFDDHLH